jgi:hypothetical protein
MKKEEHYPFHKESATTFYFKSHPVTVKAA